MSRWARFKDLLALPVNGASLAFMRIAVGLVMALEAWALFQPNTAAITMGTSPLETYYTGANIQFNFPFAGFEWLPLLPPSGIKAVVVLQGLAGIAMALGIFYRLSATTVFLSWAYLFFVESTRTYWQSHYYLELLITFLMVWMPAARRLSLDAWLARGRGAPTAVPFWTLILLRGQLVIAYFYAGVAKLNADWLLDAVPVRWFLREEHVTASWEKIFSPGMFAWFAKVIHSVGFAFLISYVGLVFDLVIGFLFLFRRTRLFALVLMAIFHATNHLLIFDDIGFFPLLGLTTALIFLDSDWPERFWRWIRHPQLKRPDWPWFWAGGILFPVVGATLGWKLRATDSTPATTARFTLPRWVAPAVTAWLVWQSLLPLRQYLIPGDGRFTYEGLSFSWRLKSDLHQARSVQMFIKDAEFIRRNEAGRNRIDWNQWHEDKVVYRKIAPGKVNWSALPELLLVVEPVVGERIVFNPLSGLPAGSPIPGDAAVRARLNQLWTGLYGRPPETVRRSLPLSQVLGSVADGLRSSGHAAEAANLSGLAARIRRFEQTGDDAGTAANARAEIRSVLEVLVARSADGGLISQLRALDPFALEGQRPLPVPFLLIDDPAVFEKSDTPWLRVNRAAWRTPPNFRPERGPLDVYSGGPPLIIYTGNVGPQARVLLPQACVFDAQDQPDQLPYVWWNTLRDLPASKLNHVSNQAFYLRRYARRVAALWKKEHGRRPIVNATTALSLNGRPHQYLVDPAADLASVPVAWFGHNSWIRDLETPRIPRETLVKGRFTSGQRPGATE